MRKTLLAPALVLALAASVYAGDIQNGVAPPPPPQNVVETTAEGQMDTPKASEDALTEIMLSLLSGILTLV